MHEVSLGTSRSVTMLSRHGFPSWTEVSFLCIICHAGLCAVCDMSARLSVLASPTGRSNASGNWAWCGLHIFCGHVGSMVCAFDFQLIFSLTVKALNWYEDREARRRGFLQSGDILREQVLLRQDYRCAISGLVEIGREKVPSCHLRISRILHSPIVGSEKTDFFGTMTREIVKNYIAPVVNLDDGPHNAIASHYDMGVFFNNFSFSLKPTTNADEYTAETYGERAWLVSIKNPIVSKGDTPPDPGYLRVHACVADVLQQSGAGRVIDKILKCLPERTCTADIIDLQGVLDNFSFRYSLVTALELPVCGEFLF
ncbi:hypothetical protein DFS33DRAFT_988000 [Desarmillaria ectypa]|nr:hypothetical protein DFS33DRAFT_988000 [Desarmillaria ectypa]